MANEDKGHCKHGEFNLAEGCPQCIAELRQNGGQIMLGEKVVATLSPEPDIVKVRYYSQTTGELSEREYTYYSVDRLSVGDIVFVPIRDRTGKAKVTAVDVPEAEIANFKDRVKTIPTSSVLRPEQEEMEAGLNQEGLTLAGDPLILPGNPATEKENMFPSILPAERTAIVKIAPGQDETIIAFYQEAKRLQEYAQARVIANTDNLKSAVDDLSIITRVKRGLEGKRKEYLKPLKEHVDQINNAFKILMEPIEEADRITRGKMLTFDQEQRRIRMEQEEVNRLKMEAAQKEMELKGELTESVNLVEVVPEAPKRVTTEMGTVGQRANWNYEVVDFALLPDEYKVADTAMLNAIAKKYHDQKPIPGVRFYCKKIITVSPI